MLCDHDRKVFSDLLDELGETYGQTRVGRAQADLVAPARRRIWISPPCARSWIATCWTRERGATSRARATSSPCWSAPAVDTRVRTRPGPWRWTPSTRRRVCAHRGDPIRRAAASPVWESGDKRWRAHGLQGAYERLVARTAPTRATPSGGSRSAGIRAAEQCCRACGRRRTAVGRGGAAPVAGTGGREHPEAFDRDGCGHTTDRGGRHPSAAEDTPRADPAGGPTHAGTARRACAGPA